MEIETLTKNEKSPWSERPWYQNCIAVMPFIRWAVIVVLALGGYYVYQRDVNAAQLVNVTDLKRDIEATKKTVEADRISGDKSFDTLRREMLTREVYEAKQEAVLQRLDRIDKTLESLLSRP